MGDHRDIVVNVDIYQSRWMLAATNISFSQKVIDTRGRFLKLAERQLPFGQLPLLQIDGAFAAGHMQGTSRKF
jgi:hypothetical protein